VSDQAPDQALEKDPSHWLRRLLPDEWLAAAETEIAAATHALERHSYRTGITHLRRGAGMACNALLWRGERAAWGRSYMEHVVALASDDDVPAELRAAAQRLRETPAAPPPLVSLARPGQLPAPAATLLAAARAIVDWAAQLSRNG
jgi:hypothetical protein